MIDVHIKDIDKYINKNINTITPDKNNTIIKNKKFKKREYALNIST